MENNNNGRGIFYGVIGVATLVVAIIGATFAYFSASISSANNALRTGTTTLTLTYTEVAENMRTDLIPVETQDNINATTNVTEFAPYPGIDTTKTSGAGTCRDDVGNSICSVYTFTISNPSETVAQTVTGSLKVTANSTNGGAGAEGGKFENLFYAVFKGTAADVSSSASGYDVNADAVDTNADGATGKLVVERTKIEAKDTIYTWENTTEQLENSTSESNSTTYTIVVWLEEAGDANNAEQGGFFSAEITFDTGDGTGVTGTIGSAT